MAERRKGKKKKDLELLEEKELTKEEISVAKYLRLTLPEKKTTLVGHKVEYFIGNKAVDCLMESKWAKNDKKSEVHFQSREAAVYFMERLLVHKMFHRAKKIVVPSLKKKKDEEVEFSKEKDSKKNKESKREKVESKKDKVEAIKEKEESKHEKEDSKKEKEESKHEKEDSKKEKKESKHEKEDSKKEKKESKKEKEETNEGAESSEKSKKKDKKGKKDPVVQKKEKKKIKLDMHLDQRFLDAKEPYVWIYEPVTWSTIRTWIIGALMVVAAVLICLFPLWPQTIRHYIYYLSVGAAFLLVFIICLAVFRMIFFVLVWLLTFGKHHIWILPNLTEDVGFFESFWPLYKYEYKGKSKDKDISSEDKPQEDENEKDKEDDEEKSDASSSEQDKKDEDNNSDSSGEKPKGEIDFEIINAEDVSDSENEEDPKTK